ncbi:MAG: hypothetical protein ACI4RO_00715 [Candidatus Scatosoma sp.]
MKKLLRFSAGLLSVPAFFSCAVSAAFQYARSPAPSGESTAEISLNAFYYGDYPADFSAPYIEVTERALSELGNSGLNSDVTAPGQAAGFRLAYLNPNSLQRSKYGYIGSMNYDFGTPETVSVVMTLPGIGITGNDDIYLYVISVSTAELAAKSLGDVVGSEEDKPLYRITLKKNGGGKYEAAEYVRGTSAVTRYEGADNIDGFAVYNKTEVFVPA